MYHIIGADGLPWGPVDATTLTKWITEGRANGQTNMCPDGGSEWKPLTYYPEFATALSQAQSNVSAHTSEGDATDGLIPYKNVPALVGYYMGVLGLIPTALVGYYMYRFGLIPMFIPIAGIVYALVVITLGIFGLVAVKKRPEKRGTAHCVVALLFAILEIAVCGFITFKVFGG